VFKSGCEIRAFTEILVFKDPVKIEIFTLCDAATDSGGKLNVLGSFDHLHTRETPVTHALCAIAVKIRFAKIEEGAHRLRITFVDADGKSVLPDLDAALQVQCGGDEATVAANVVLVIQQMKLLSFGEYEIALAIDGRLEASIPLYVRPVKDAVPGSMP
jgi:hypothetical protein